MHSSQINESIFVIELEFQSMSYIDISSRTLRSRIQAFKDKEQYNDSNNFVQDGIMYILNLLPYHRTLGNLITCKQKEISC